MSHKEETEPNEKEAPVISTQVKTGGLLSGLGNLSDLLNNLGGLVNQAMESDDSQPVVTQGSFTGSVQQWAEKHGLGVPKDTFKLRSYPPKKSPSALKKEHVAPSPNLEVFEEESEYIITGPCPGYAEEDFCYKVEDGVLVITAWNYEQKFTLPKDLDWTQHVIEVKNGFFLCTCERGDVK